MTAFGDDPWDSTEVRTALATDRRTVTHQLIWLLHHRKRVPSMSRLTSWTLSARTTSTAGQTPRTIRGGRLTARATILCQSFFQLLDPGLRLFQLLFQGQQFRDQCFEEAIFFSQGLQFVFVRHSCTLVDFLCFGKSRGDLSSYK